MKINVNDLKEKLTMMIQQGKEKEVDTVLEALDYCMSFDDYMVLTTHCHEEDKRLNK